MHAVSGIAGAMRPFHRLLLASVISVGLLLGLTSTPAHAAETDNRGLFGSQDPTYDGVDRQATAILGLAAVGAQAPPLAVDWLLNQQCDDGSFTAYRVDPTQPCGPADLTTYTGPNTNSTSLAAMALTALAAQKGKGHRFARQAATRAVAWLVGQQQEDGGWEWLKGLGSDSTSTAMTLAAVNKPKSTTHRRGVAFLSTTLRPDTGCGLSFTPDSGVVDPLSTSWAFIATQGPLPYAPHRGARSLTTCVPAQVDVSASGSWLASQLTVGSGQIPSAFDPGATDWNSTALATLGMTQPEGSTQAMRLGLAALQANVAPYVDEDSVDRAAPLGTLLMVAHATKSDPRAFGGTNLIRRLLATLQK